MSDIAQFPDKDAVFIGLRYDEETDMETYLLEQFIGGKRTRVGEYPTMMDLVLAMDEIAGIDRSGGAA